MNLEELTLLRKELNKFKVVKCDMVHERVLIDKEGVPQVKDALQDYMRQSLCPIEQRSVRLGCSHSHSNSQFDQSLEQVAKQDVEIQRLRTDLNVLITEVYRLDHEKGNLEKDKADHLFMHPDNLGAIETTNALLDTTISAHRNLLDKIDQKRKAIITRIDHLLDEINEGSN